MTTITPTFEKFVLDKVNEIQSVLSFIRNEGGLTHAQKNGLLLYVDHIATQIKSEIYMRDFKEYSPHSSNAIPVMRPSEPEDLPF